MVLPVKVKWQDLGIRTVSAFVLIPAVLADIWIGGAWFALFVALLCVLMAYEWTAIVYPGNPGQFAFHAAAALAGALLPLEAGCIAALVAIAGLWAASVAAAWAAGQLTSRWAALGVVYVGLPAIAFVVLRQDPSLGLVAISWLFIVVWTADILAYFAGRIIGGPKLWPAVSPNKTWAGLGGAVGGGALAGYAFSAWQGLDHAAIPMVIGGLLGVVEQGGDLFESALKRHFGVKDSSRLIPGHGGVLDRVDGLVAAAMAAAVLGVAHGGTGAAGAGLLVW